MKLIVNRTDELFNAEFPEYDHYYICMKLLAKASRNQIRGLTYDKIKLVKLISPSSNQEMIEALDRAVVYLLSRGLIERRKINDFRSLLSQTHWKSFVILISARLSIL